MVCMCRDQRAIAKHMGSTRSVPAVRAHLTKHRKRVQKLISQAAAAAAAEKAAHPPMIDPAASGSAPPSPIKV